MIIHQLYTLITIYWIMRPFNRLVQRQASISIVVTSRNFETSESQDNCHVTSVLERHLAISVSAIDCFSTSSR